MTCVLVVDDDRMMAQTLREILALQQWAVDVAHDGRTAVEMVSRTAYDVVVMDVKMPGMDGLSAFRVMQQARPSLKVVLMTAFGAESLGPEALDSGVLRVFSKPVDIRSLLADLARVCRGVE